MTGSLLIYPFIPGLDGPPPEAKVIDPWGWIAGGLGQVASVEGAVRIDALSGETFAFQSIATIPGATYTWTFEISLGGGFATVGRSSTGSEIVPPVALSVGTARITWVADGGPTYLRLYRQVPGAFYTRLQEATGTLVGLTPVFFTDEQGNLLSDDNDDLLYELEMVTGSTFYLLTDDSDAFLTTEEEERLLDE